MKSKIKRFLIVLAALAGVVCFLELINLFISGATLISYQAPNDGRKLTFLSDGFTDRDTTVFLERGIGRPLNLFRFDPYHDGPFSAAWSAEGRYFQFRQGNTMRVYDLETGKEASPDPISVFTDFINGQDHEPMGVKPWAIQESWYDTD